MNKSLGKIPFNEEAIPQSLERLNSLDVAAQADSELLVQPGSSICNVPICKSSLVDKNQKLFKTNNVVESDSSEDIIEQNNMLERLANSEERYRSLYNSTPVMMQTIDAQGRLTSVNDYWLEKHGYSREEVLGRHTSEFHTPESAQYLLDVVIPMVWKNGHCENIAYQRVKKTGEVFDVILSANCERDSAGNPLRSMAVLVDVTAENAAKHALQEQKNHIQQIVDNHNTATFMIDTNHNVTHWNKRCEVLTGVKAAEILGQTAWRGFYHKERPTLADLVLNEQREQASAYYTKSLASDLSDKAWYVENWQEELKHGKKKYVSAEASKIVDTEGNTVGVIETITDMTQYKYAEMALLAQKNQIHQMLDNQSVATFIIDRHHKVTHWNKACALLTGVDEQTMLGQESWRGFYPQVRPCLADMVLDNNFALANTHYALSRASVLTEKGLHVENWFENLGGKKRYLIFDAAPIYDEQGDIIAVIETLQDTTESKLAELALNEERQYLAAVIECTQAGTWRWNVATGESHFNEIWAGILGYTLEELDSQNSSRFETWAKLTHPDDVEATSLKLQAHFKQQEQDFETEFRMRHKNGEWVWILSRGRVLTWLNDGQPEWMYGTHLDITELKSQQEALVLANERVNIATQSSKIGIWSYDIVNDVLECDSTIYSFYGLAPDQILTRSTCSAMMFPEDRNNALLAYEKAIADECDYEVEYRIIWQDGSVHYMQSKAAITRDKNGKALHMLGTEWDVTALRELALEVTKQHEILRVTLQSIADAVITTDPKGMITWLNPVAERLTGWLLSEVKDKSISNVYNIVNEKTRKAEQNPVSECLKVGKVTGLANNTVLITRDGTEYGIEDSASPIRSEDGSIIGAVLVFHDVTEQRRLNNEISHRATYDQLTGLINRTEFENQLTYLFNCAKNDGSVHTLIFIDLDQFKLVNDTCGHAAGDILLQQVSKMFGEIVRSRDTLSRFGGDEFAVLLEKCTPQQAQRVAQAICDRMDEYRFIHDGKRFRIGASIGLAILDKRWESINDVIQAADSACYAAKEAGRNRVHTWIDTDFSMQKRRGTMDWVTQLEKALDENRFELYLQRIIPSLHQDLTESANAIHAEILLRMRSESDEIIAPGIFMPAAERFHLSSRIDRWVLDHVITWMQSFHNISSICTIFVNLSGQSIGDKLFHSYAIQLLRSVGEDCCKRLCLEITETATVTNLVDASIFIEQVRELGVRVALDDFGAGASSFGYLKTLNVDILKIDGQFIKGMINDQLDDSAVRCFVDVARIAGLKTVAEYVESEAIQNHVRMLDIDYAQGYLIHQPAPIKIAMETCFSIA